MNSEILIYQNPEGNIKIDVRLEEETVWLTQDQMATLFCKGRSTIAEHIINVYDEVELEQSRTCRKFRQVRQEGNREVEREIDHYNLDVIISVGYRVKSPQGTQFRIWATQRLKEYIIKGFALNDERFKSGSSMNYFTELQERIREIRLSERFFYQKIKDIYTDWTAFCNSMAGNYSRTQEKSATKWHLKNREKNLRDLGLAKKPLRKNKV